jgi:phenylpropionate dioxygenase-like ring-hydroxylating dioxygenase large terminal subunit
MLDAPLAQALADVRRPVGEARGLPNALYVDPAMATLERQRLFFDTWSCIGFAADVPGPGDAVPVNHLGAPLLLLRDHAGALRVFQNVCRHRGMILVQAAQNFAGVIRCPYHSWCYSLEGALRATPHVGGPGINRHAAIEPGATGLVPVRAETFLGCVFVTLSASAPPFADWIAPLAARWADFAGQTLHAGAGSAFALEVRANWKLAVENYCESYHLPWVHPGLNSYSRLEDHYHIEAPGAFSGQGSLKYQPDLGEPRFPDFPGLPDRWATLAEYAALYPNLLLGVHRDHVFAMLLEPLAQDRTGERVQLWYAGAEAATGERFAPARARNAALWREVFAEDVFVVEGMQKGRHAPGFDGGRFSPAMDGPTHLFHDWVATRLAG